MELIGQLVSQLGVKEDAAKGGAGLLFKLAQEKLWAGDFSKASGALPGISDLISSAPEAGGVLGGIGKLVSSFGGGGSKLGSLASLAGGFSKLGLDGGMVSKFIPIILSFAESKGGGAVKAILEKALK